MDEITSTTQTITQKDAQAALRNSVAELIVSNPKTGIDWLKGFCKAAGPTSLMYAAATPEGGHRNTLMAVGIGLSILAAYLSDPRKSSKGGKNNDIAPGG